MKIAVDIDDTLNVVRRLELAGAYIERKGLPFRTVDPASNKLLDIFDWTEEDVLHFIREEGGLVLYTDAEARKGAKETLEKWRAMGHKIVVLTSRRSEWFNNPERVSRDWLEKRHIPYDEIAAEIPLSGKGAYCAENGISLLVDDDPDACLGAQRRKVAAILMIGRHNAERAHEIRFGGTNWRQIDAAARSIFAGLGEAETEKRT